MVLTFVQNVYRRSLSSGPVSRSRSPHRTRPARTPPSTFLFLQFNLSNSPTQMRQSPREGENLYLQIFQSEIHQAASSGCQRPEGSEPVDPPEEGSNLFLRSAPIISFETSSRTLHRSRSARPLLRNLTTQPDDKTPTETVGWCFTHRVEVLLSVEPSRTRGPRRRRAQWPVYSLALSKLSTPNRQKIVTRFSCA